MIREGGEKGEISSLCNGIKTDIDAPINRSRFIIGGWHYCYQSVSFMDLASLCGVMDVLGRAWSGVSRTWTHLVRMEAVIPVVK